MGRSKRRSSAVGVNNPLAKAVGECFGLLGVFGRLEQLPPLPKSKHSTSASWQWNQFNPNWSEYVSDAEIAREIVTIALQSARKSLEDARDEFFAKDWRIRQPKPTDPDPQWASSCAVTIGQLLSYLNFPYKVKRGDTDLYLACRVSRDRLTLDGFAGLIRALAGLHAQLIGSRGSIKKSTPFIETNSPITGPGMGLPMQKKQIAGILGITVKTLNACIANKTYKVKKHSHKTHQIDLHNVPPELHPRFLLLS